jgi:hypothetical protein
MKSMCGSPSYFQRMLSRPGYTLTWMCCAA